MVEVTLDFDFVSQLVLHFVFADDLLLNHFQCHENSRGLVSEFITEPYCAWKTSLNLPLPRNLPIWNRSEMFWYFGESSSACLGRFCLMELKIPELESSVLCERSGERSGDLEAHWRMAFWSRRAEDWIILMRLVSVGGSCSLTSSALMISCVSADCRRALMFLICWLMRVVV